MSQCTLYTNRCLSPCVSESSLVNVKRFHTISLGNYAKLDDIVILLFILTMRNDDYAVTIINCCIIDVTLRYSGRRVFYLSPSRRKRVQRVYLKKNNERSPTRNDKRRLFLRLKTGRQRGTTTITGPERGRTVNLINKH